MLGILRLRICFAARSKFLAQDENLFKFPAAITGASIMKIIFAVLPKAALAVCGFLIANSILCPAQNSAASTSSAPPQQTLIGAEKDLIAAKIHDDDAYFKRTVSDDFVFVGVDGQLLEGQEAIDNLGDSDLAELMPYDMKVAFAGGSAAIVTYDAVVREKPREDQGPPPRYQHFSSVWVKQGDAWKLKFQQATATKWGDW